MSGVPPCQVDINPADPSGTVFTSDALPAEPQGAALDVKVAKPPTRPADD